MRLRRAAAILACAISSATAGQALQVGATVTSTALYAGTQLSTDFDQGGSFHWGGVLAAGDVLHQFTPQFAAGMSLRYEYQDWHFSNPVAFGGAAPWNNLNFPQIGATLVYTPAEDWNLAFIPTVEWAYESGASTGDALNYGAVVSAAKVFSPTLTLGLGAAVYHQIYHTKVFPFPVVDWQIDEHWKLTNPFQAGPAGGAGLELVYAFNDRWEAGAGGSYRSLVYRLAADGPVGNGIGENNFIPLFLRVSWQLGKQTQLDFYAAALTSGKLTVKNASGNDVTNDSYQTAPALGVTLQTRF